MELTDLAIPCVVLFYVYWEFWSLVVLAVAVLARWLFTRHRKRTATTKIAIGGRGVLITGCDTGIGHATAIRLHELGFTVFAGCFNTTGSGARQLQEYGPSMHVLSLDVTKDDSVHSTLAFVQNNCPHNGLWAVINNAGINIMADVELATLDMYKRVAEVNIYGMIRVTKAFCPLVRKFKGRFINVTSVKGRMCGPLDSTYTITKWAGEAFSDILRREMIRFGVKVIIMEPGDFGGLTGMLSKETLERMEWDLNSAWDLANNNVRQAYGREYVDALLSGIQQAGTTCAASLDPVINAMEDAVTNTDPSYRYLVDGSSSVMDKYCVFARLTPFLPDGLMDRILPFFYPLPPVKQKVA